MLIKIFIAGFILLIMDSCTDTSKRQPSQSQMPATASIKNAYIILCDFSNSIDTTATRKKIVNDALRIYDRIKDSSLVSFYPIKGQSFSYVIDQYEKKIPILKTDEDKMLYKIDEIKKRARFQSVIEKASKENNENKSCIISTIDRFVGQISNFKKAGVQNIYLIILSDMLEVCTSSIGSINLEKDDFSDAEQKLEAYPIVKNGFNEFENLRIIVVISNGKDKSYQKLNNFWKKYFQKMGYKNGEDLDTELPLWF